MFWNWVFFILYSVGTVCSIADMGKVEKIKDKLFRVAIASVLYILTNLYGVVIMIEILGI